LPRGRRDRDRTPEPATPRVQDLPTLVVTPNADDGFMVHRADAICTLEGGS
jgi:hypothetical protein